MAQLFVHITQLPAAADAAIIPHASSFAWSSLNSLQLGLPFISYNLYCASQSSEIWHLSAGGIQVKYNESGGACRQLGRVNGWCQGTWRYRSPRVRAVPSADCHTDVCLRWQVEYWSENLRRCCYMQVLYRCAVNQTGSFRTGHAFKTG